MPSLHAHMRFAAHFADQLRTSLPDAARAVDAHWPAALLGSQAPDAWYFIAGAKRPDMHVVDRDDPQSWEGALERWLQQRPALSPGRDQPEETAAFVVGCLTHLGLDVWAEQYQDADLPAEARERAPAAWFPAELSDPKRLQAALRALTEAPMPPERIRSAEQLDRAPVPDGFPAAEVKRVAAGVAPGLALTDPWAISRISPFRELPDTPAERAKWEQQRAANAPATPEEVQALLDAATDFTLRTVSQWW